MSDQLPAKPTENPFQDFTIKDLEKIEKFKENGMMGLHLLKDTDVERCMSLYLDGKSYRQIANVLKIDRVVIMFLSKKFDWFELRKDYLDELQSSLKTKVLESKLQSQEFLLHVQLALQKKIGKDIDKFFRTGDDKFIDEVDSKHLVSYLKITETIHKLDAEGKYNQTDKSLVSLNGLAEGVNITRTGTNSVEITPKTPSPFSNKLKAFADLKREQEKANQAPTKPIRDIKVVSEKPSKPENEGSNEENSN